MSLEPRRCDVMRCNRLHHARGLCLMHYRRQQRTGNVGAAQAQHERRQPCPVIGCTNVCHAKGRCLTHYLRMRRRERSGAGFIETSIFSEDQPDLTATHPTPHNGADG